MTLKEIIEEVEEVYEKYREQMLIAEVKMEIYGELLNILYPIEENERKEGTDE